jgi:hypothetical protein
MLSKIFIYFSRVIKMCSQPITPKPIKLENIMMMNCKKKGSNVTENYILFASWNWLFEVAIKLYIIFRQIKKKKTKKTHNFHGSGKYNII